jgi:hypothetical protein
MANLNLRGIEVWYEGLFIKRWKYRENILNNEVLTCQKTKVKLYIFIYQTLLDGI